MGLFDRFKSKQLTPEERDAEFQKSVGYGFGDYWWIRDEFVRMMLDIKGPISVPWYRRRSVVNFIYFWHHPGIVQAMRVRLTQVDRMHEYPRIEKLHNTSEEMKDLSNKGVLTEEDVKRISEFLDEAAIVLHSIDNWFCREYWPDHFRPVDNRGEFENMSIKTALMHAPFRN